MWKFWCFLKMYFFSALPNVVGVFGETKKFHMVRNTAFGRGEVGGPDGRYYIFRGIVIRVQEADMYERLVTRDVKCVMLWSPLWQKNSSPFFTYKKIVLQNNFACVRYLHMSRFLMRKQFLIISSSLRYYLHNILARLKKDTKNYLTSQFKVYRK